MHLYQNQGGSINVLLIPLILASIFFFGAAGFAAWAYTERQSYKNDVDQKIAVAVKVAEDELSSKKDNEFLEREKEPLRTYQGPSVFGEINFSYPKTWSGYVEEKGDSMQLLMNPKLVQGGKDNKYAVRLEVVNASYDRELKKLENDIKTGKIRASAYRLDKLKEVLGVRIDGEIDTGVTGSAVMLPLRDKTIIVRTESPEFINDFNKIILSSFTFSP